MALCTGQRLTGGSSPARVPREKCTEGSAGAALVALLPALLLSH